MECLVLNLLALLEEKVLQMESEVKHWMTIDSCDGEK